MTKLQKHYNAQVPQCRQNHQTISWFKQSHTSSFDYYFCYSHFFTYHYETRCKIVSGNYRSPQWRKNSGNSNNRKMKIKRMSSQVSEILTLSIGQLTCISAAKCTVPWTNNFWCWVINLSDHRHSFVDKFQPNMHTLKNWLIRNIFLFHLFKSGAQGNHILWALTATFPT